MIDLRTIACSPLDVDTGVLVALGGETTCPGNWSGAYTTPSRAVREYRLRWPEASDVDAQAFRAMLAETLGGRVPVVVTPPTSPLGVSLVVPRPAQQSTIVGRLQAGFKIRKSGSNLNTIEAVLEEDL